MKNCLKQMKLGKLNNKILNTEKTQFKRTEFFYYNLMSFKRGIFRRAQCEKPEFSGPK